MHQSLRTLIQLIYLYIIRHTLPRMAAMNKSAYAAIVKKSPQACKGFCQKFLRALPCCVLPPPVRRNHRRCCANTAGHWTAPHATSGPLKPGLLRAGVSSQTGKAISVPSGTLRPAALQWGRTGAISPTLPALVFLIYMFHSFYLIQFVVYLPPLSDYAMV